MAKTRIIDDDADEEAAKKAEAEHLAALNEASGGDLFAAVDELRGSAGASGVVCIITRTAPQGKTGYCGQLSVSDFSREKLRTLYGAGRYMVQIKSTKGFLPGGGPVEIAEVSETLKGAGGDVLTFMEFIQKQETERKAKSDERNARLLELGIPALGTVLAAFLNRNTGTDVTALVAALKPAPGPSLNDLTGALVNMKQLTGGDAEKDPYESIIKMMEAVKNLGSDSNGKGETNWLDVVQTLVKEIGPAAKPILEGLQAQMAARQQPAVIMQQPAMIQPNVAHVQPATDSIIVPSAEIKPAIFAEKSENDMLQMFMPMIKNKLAQIAQWAQQDRNPQTYAEVFIDELPPNINQYITQAQALEYLNHEKWFETVCEYEPKLVPFKGWCEEFRIELIELIKIPPSDEINENSSETVSDIAGDGTARESL